MIAKYPSKKVMVEIKAEDIHQTKSAFIGIAGMILSRNISEVDPSTKPIIIQ